MNLLEAFRNYLFSQDTKPSGVTVKNYLSDINHFIRWYESYYQKTFDPIAITHQTIETYKNEVSGISYNVSGKIPNTKYQILSPRSLERHLSSLRKFFTFLKLEGKISVNPFDQQSAVSSQQSADPYRLKDFKSNLYVFNASHLTIKNYLIDIKQFLAWAQEVTGAVDVLGIINSGLVEEYKQRLLSQGTFSPATINRKLSSLRKYTAWLEAEGLVSGISYDVSSIEKPKPSPVLIPEAKDIQNTKYKILNTRYSSFPPLRLFQKVTKVITIALDAILITQLVKIIEKAEEVLWKAKGQPVFKRFKTSDLRLQKLNLTSYILNHKSFDVKNIKKELYAPLEISTQYFPWYKKAWHTLRYKRPKWYKTYHSYAITHYFNFAVLIIFIVGLAFGFYNAFVQGGSKSPTLAALPTNPPRVLSFQGRLTDNNDNPITAGTNLRFAIYRDSLASGSALQWQEVNRVEPDVDGIFNVILGNNTPISSQVFFENNALWLGVTVEATSELTPRQPIATVAFATNAETLQGLLPITATASGTTNVVLALNSSGNLVIGGTANPIFRANGGQFTLTGQALVLNTNSTSNGNIQLAPDGQGRIDLTKPLQNTSLSNNISSAVGSVEVDDLFSILATSSGQSALTINQTGGGPLISASASGVNKFAVDNSGNIKVAPGTTIDTFSAGSLGFGISTANAVSIGNSGATLALSFSGLTSNQNSVLYSGASGNIGAATTPTASLCLVSNSTPGNPSWQTCPGGSQTIDAFWNQTLGALYPNNSTVDLLVGGQATTSAKFALLNINGTRGLQTASLSGSLVLDSSTAGIQTTNNQLLTIGGNTTGDIKIESGGSIILKPSAGNKTISITLDGLIGFVINPTDNLNFSSSIYPTNDVTYNLGASGASWAYIYTNVLLSGTGENLVLDSAGGTIFAYDTLNFFSTAPDITTSSNGHLSIVPNGTGLIGLNTNTPLASTDIRGKNGTISVASVSGQTSFASLVVNNDGVGDLFTASSSGTNKFSIARTGLITAPQYNTCTLKTDVNGLFTCGVDNNSGVNWWNQLAGALSPVDTTNDFLLGSTATSSALFSYTGIKTGQTIASISGQLLVYPNNGYGGNASISAGLVIGANSLPTIQTTRNQGLTIGGNTTGNITLNPNNGTAGLVSITGSSLFTTGTGLTTIGGNLTVNGATTTFNNASATLTTGTNQNLTINPNGSGILNLNTSGTGATNIGTSTNTGAVAIGNSSGVFSLTSSGGLNVTAGGALTGVASIDTITTSATALTFAGAGSLAAGGTSNLALDAGTSGAVNIAGVSTGNVNLAGGSAATGCTVVNATGELACSGAIYSTVSTGIQGWWNVASGSLFPTNSTLDFLIGGQSSASAKFRVTGASPFAGTLSVASISGKTSFASLVANNDGVGDLFTASASGWTRFAITNGGAFRLVNSYGLTGECLKSGGSATVAVSWGTCGSGGDTLWGQSNGLLYPANSTVDLAIGGTASTSAIFAFTNVNSGTPTLKIWDSAAHNNSLNLSATATDASINATTGIINIGQGGGTLYVQTDIQNDGSQFGSGIQISDKLNILPVASGNVNSNAALLVNNPGTGDIFTASSGGTTRFTITNAGFLLPGTAATSGTQDIGSPTQQWRNIYATGSVAGFWQRLAGNLSPLNTNDTLAATSSAYSPATFTTNNPAGTITNNTLIQQTGAGTVTNLLNLTQSAGGATNAINLSGTFTNLINSTNFSVANSGTITTNGGYTQSGSTANTFSGATTISSTGTALTLSGAATTAISISNTGVTTDISLQNAETLDNNTDNTINLGFGAAGGILNLTSTTNSVINASARLDLQSDGGVNVNLAGGSTLTGCTVTNSNGNLDCTGIISSGGTALTQYWQRLAGNLSPLNINDTLAATSSAYSPATFTTNNPAGTITNNTLIQQTGAGTVTNLLNLTQSAGGATNAINLSGTFTNLINSTNFSVANGGNITTNGTTITAAGLTTITSSIALNLNPNTGTSYTLNTSATTLTAFGTPTTLTLGNAAGTFNIGPGGATATSINLAGGSGATGCTVDGATGNLTCAGNILTTATTGLQGWWNVALGSLYPTNSTLDFFIGGQSTSSAKFALININGARGTQTASLSGSLTLDSTTASLQSVKNQLLTIGGNTTGNITLAPLNGIVGSNVIPNTDQQVDLGLLTNEWRNIYGQNIYQNGVLLSQYWQRNSGALSPVNITDDLLLGATATSTAQFSVSNIAKNQAVASLSGQFIVMPNNGWGGQVGIGKTPTRALDFVSATTAQGGIGFGADLQLFRSAVGTAQFDSNSQSTDAVVAIVSPGGGFDAQLTLFDGGSLSNARVRLSSRSNGGLLFGPGTSTQDVRIYRPGTSKLTLDSSSGDALTVGINTSTLLSTLDIRANTTNGGTISVASVSGRTSFAALVIDNQGLGDLITASSSATPLSGRTQFTVTNAGSVYARSFYDLDNPTYFLDPAATATSLTTAGSVGIGVTAPSAMLSINQTGNNDILLASMSGDLRFKIGNNGNVVINANTSTDDLTKTTTSDFTQAGSTATSVTTTSDKISQNLGTAGMTVSAGPNLTTTVSSGSHSFQRPDGKFVTMIGNSVTTNIYDPATNTFSAGPTLTANAYVGAHSFQRPDGKFVTIIGSNTTTTNIYDPATNTFSAGPVLSAAAGTGSHSFQRPDGKFVTILGNNTTTTNIYDPSTNSFSAGTALSAAAYNGSHSFQRPDGKFVTILGNSITATSIIDVGWSTRGSWESEAIDLTGKLSTSSALFWKSADQNSTNPTRVDPKNIIFNIRTANTSGGLSSAPYASMSASGDRIPLTTNAANTAQNFVQIRINFNVPIPGNPNRSVSPVIESNVWGGESNTFYLRDFAIPTVFEFTIKNPIVSKGGSGALANNWAGTLGGGIGTSSAQLINLDTDNNNALKLTFDKNAPAASGSKGLQINAGPALTANTGTGSHSFQRPDGKYVTIIANATTTTNIYDPATNTFSAGPALTAAASNGSHSFQRPDGKFVTILGGVTTTTNIYDPATNTFSAGPALTNTTGSGSHSFQRPDGKFVTILGNNHTTTNIYDPATNTFSAGPALTNITGSGSHSFQRPDGKFVTILGSLLITTNIYDPATNTFSAGPALTASANYGAHSFQRPDGKFVTILGNASNATNIYDPATNTFSAGPALTANAGVGSNSFQRPDGKFVTIFGNASTATNIYDPATNTFSAGPALTAAVFGGSHSFQRPDGKFVTILSNGGTTNIIDAGWELSGTYISEPFSESSIGNSTVLNWDRGGNSNGKVTAKVRTATSLNGLSAAAWNDVEYSGANIGAGTNTFVQVRFDLEGTLSGYGGSEKNVWLGESSFIPFRTPFSPTLASFSLTNNPAGNVFVINGENSALFRFTAEGSAYSGPNGAWYSGGADVAEYYPSTQKLKPGELVSADPTNIDDQAYVVRNTEAYQKDIVGIVSTKPGFVAGAYTEDAYPIALAGRVPVKVSTVNGEIKVGDPLTSSSIPGVAMKATKPGQIIGKALQPFSCQQSATSNQPSVTDTGSSTSTNGSLLEASGSTCEGTITAYVNVGYNDPTPPVVADVLSIKNYVLSMLENGSYRVTDAFGNTITRAEVLAGAVIGNLQAGVANIRQLTSDNIISPIASIDTLNTNLISPLAKDSQISLKFNNNQLSIINNPEGTGSAVASIDNTGNASFSGSLSVGSDASIAGTLRAGKIIASEIEGLNPSVTNITNIYNSTQSATSNPFPTLIATSNQQLATSSGTSSYIDVAPFASELAYVENLNAVTATFSQGLMVFGSTTLSDTSVVGQLSVNGSLILADNSINVLGSDLNLQPLRQGGLSIMAGLFYIDTNGNAAFGSDVTVKGTLYANAISSLPGQDLTLKLATSNQQLATSSSEILNTKYKIQNTNGSDVLSVNQLGDLIASGAGTFGKLNLSLVSPALALSPTEVIATGSAGTGSINAGRTQMTINNKLVTEKSLIYITPTSNTNQTLFLLKQVPKESFTVGVQNESLMPIQFNWIIVN